MKYDIDKADLNNEKDSILALVSENLIFQSKQWYVWKYISCPDGPASCWLARVVLSGDPAGMVVLFPRKIRVNGEIVESSVAGDYAVGKKYRVFGPAVMLQKKIIAGVEEGEYKFVYSVPNKLSEPLLLKLGYVTVGNINRFAKILRAEYANGKYVPPAGITKVLSGAVNIVLRIFSRETIFRTPKNYEVEMAEVFDDKYDVLWEKSSKQHSIIAVRNSVFLNWRYTNSPVRDYKIFSIIKEKKEVAGYMVYYMEDNVCNIVDVLYSESDSAANVLFKEFIRYLRERKAGSISIHYIGNSSFEKILKKFNFIQRKKEDLKLVVYCSNKELKQYITDKEKWYFTIGDNDV